MSRLRLRRRASEKLSESFGPFDRPQCVVVFPPPMKLGGFTIRFPYEAEPALDSEEVEAAGWRG